MECRLYNDILNLPELVSRISLFAFKYAKKFMDRFCFITDRRNFENKFYFDATFT